MVDAGVALVPSAGLVAVAFAFAAAGCWLLLLPACCLRFLLVACCLLVAGCWLLVVGYWLLVTGCWLSIAGCWFLLVVCCWVISSFGPVSAAERSPADKYASNTLLSSLEYFPPLLFLKIHLSHGSAEFCQGPLVASLPVL